MAGSLVGDMELESSPLAVDGAPGRPGGFANDELPALFELLGRIGRAVALTVGPDCEVVVHDLRQPAHSVVAITGTLTGRRVGAPVPDPQLLPGVVDQFTEDELRRRASTTTGRDLVASTAWIRDQGGHVVGAMCINIDQSGLRQARDLIAARIGGQDDPGRPITSFATDVAEFTRTAVSTALGGPLRRRLRASERVELIRRLDADGAFALRGAAEAIAAELGVSRSSVYNDLRDVRRGGSRATARPSLGGPWRRVKRKVDRPSAGEGAADRRGGPRS